MITWHKQMALKLYSQHQTDDTKQSLGSLVFLKVQHPNKSPMSKNTPFTSCSVVTEYPECSSQQVKKKKKEKKKRKRSKNNANRKLKTERKCGVHAPWCTQATRNKITVNVKIKLNTTAR